METTLSAPDLANSATAFATLLAGVTTFLLAHWVRPQPGRWMWVWFSIFLTGIPTLGWHGFPSKSWHILDIGSNLLVGWSLQNAVLGDFFSSTFRRRFLTGSAVVNSVATIAMVFQSELADSVTFGAFGGYHWGEMSLIADSLSVIGLLTAARALITDHAAPLIRMTAFTFLVGLALSTAKGTTVHFTVLSYHALWHVVSAFGFVFLWAFVHVQHERPRHSFPIPASSHLDTPTTEEAVP